MSALNTVDLAKDNLHRFIFEGSNVRGGLVYLDEAWRTVLERADYPDPVRQVLGDALTAASLMASTIKIDGSIILQIKSSGPIKLLVVEATSERTVRGLARFDETVVGGALRELMPDGHLVMTIDPGQGRERYQGIVDLKGKTIADCLHHYFEVSEQLPTRFWLATDNDRAVGMLVQNMPKTEATSGGGESTEEDADAWNRVGMLAETVTADELLSLPAASLLHRLFHEERVRLFEPVGLVFRCSCSRERVSNVLRSLGHASALETLEEQGAVKVDCEFCNSTFRFDAVDIEALFAEGDQHPLTDTRH